MQGEPPPDEVYYKWKWMTTDEEEEGRGVSGLEDALELKPHHVAFLPGCSCLGVFTVDDLVLTDLPPRTHVCVPGLRLA